MEQIESSSEIIKEKLRTNFDGKIVRKDLTKKIKEGTNVPVYVLEFLLGQYCSSDDPEIVENGVQTVKRILADNFVRPDEAQKVLSMLRKKGSHTVSILLGRWNIYETRYFRGQSKNKKWGKTAVFFHNLHSSGSDFYYYYRNTLE